MLEFKLKNPYFINLMILDDENAMNKTSLRVFFVCLLLIINPLTLGLKQ